MRVATHGGMKARVGREATLVAHQLHDTVGQSLTAAAMLLDRLMESPLLGPADRHLVVKTNSLISRAFRELRQAIDGVLSARTPVNREDFERLLEELESLGLSIAYKNELEGFVEPELMQCLFSAAREAVTNIRRHAEARTVTFELRRQPRDIALEISDDGRGMTRRRGGRSTERGLSLVRESVRGLGGVFRIWSRQGAGTRVSIRLPLRPMSCATGANACTSGLRASEGDED